MVVSHLRVAVRFPPTREGSGTKSSGRRPKNRASFQVSPTVSLYFFWLDIYVLGLRFLAPPPVTSASEVLTQTYRSLGRVEVSVTSRASVEVHFVDVEGSVRRIWFHILHQSSFQSRQFNSTQLRHRKSPLQNVYTLPERSLALTRTSSSAISDISPGVVPRLSWRP